LVLCSGKAICQEAKKEAVPRPPDNEIYASFFWHVAQDDESNTFYPPAPGQPIVLREYERQALKVTAADYKSKTLSLRAAVSSLRLEVLYQSIESDQAPERLRQQLEDLQARQAKLSLDYFQALKPIFGASRFQMIQEFVGSWDPDGGSPFTDPASPHYDPQLHSATKKK